MRGTLTLRPSGPSFTRSRFGTLLVMLAVVALVASCASTPPTPPLPSLTPLPSSLPSSTPGVSPSPSPTAPPEAWTRLDVAPLAEVARLEPTKAGRAGVAVDTAFRLTSLDGRQPAELARALVASPALDLAVTSVDGATAVVTPRAPLRAGTTYRISLARADGTTEASWAAVAAGALEVTDSVPGNQATGVPRNTGIELTFNQYGVSIEDVRTHFTISPKVAGTFRAAGRTIAFAPSTPLRRATLYTVTVRHGLPLPGTGQVLGRDVVIRFETRASAVARVSVSFRHALADANPREQAAVTIDVNREDEAAVPKSLPVTVHRLAGLDAAIAAYRTIRAYPQWTVASDVTPVGLGGLPRAWKGTATVRVASGDTYWIRLPKLPAGWYVVTERWGGVPRQVVLQVTDVSAFALAAVDRTAGWVNDVATGGPIAGATVALDGRRVGVTDARGLTTWATPAAVEDAASGEDAILVIRDGGRATFLPLQAQWACGGCWWEYGNTTWWRALGTDRVTYRSTDTINVWGIARNRDTDRVPAAVRLELRSTESDETGTPPIAAATTTPDANGAFTASLAVTGLPVGSYRLRFLADGHDLGETWLEVRTIVKPAYRLEVTTDRHAVIRGQSVTATVQAAFFEGTPVAGTSLMVGEQDHTGRTVSTDATGTAAARVRMVSSFEEQWQTDAVTARPTLPEEADIGGSAEVVVFHASAVVDVDPTIDGSILTLTGKVSDVAFDRYEHAGGSLWDVDPRGDGRPNARVRLSVIEHTSVRRQTGTQYDFIRKVVVPVYDYTERLDALPVRTATTGADGAFRVTIGVRGGPSHWYVVRATYVDEAGRSTTAEGWGQSTETSDTTEGVHLERADGRFETDGYEYSVGEPVRVSLLGGGGEPAGSRYLFAVTARRLAYVTTGTSHTFRTTFDEAWLPGFAITGVRFNGNGYEAAVASYRTVFRTDDRKLTVVVTADRASYAPGGTATLTLRVTDPAGHPVAATALVRVVDEKLFATGAASESDTLGLLYEQVESGVRTWGATHRTPWDDLGWGKGDTTGGGEGGDVRDDFRDWLLASLVRTGADGTASVPVPLSDDLTSWHVSVSAVTRGLQAGQGSLLVPVALPLFVEATVAPEYLAADRPAIRVRGFGTGLTAADTVTFTVSSDSLPLAAVTATAKAYQVAEIGLPALSVGTHRLRIEASAGTGAARRSDTLIRTFTVVATRVTQAKTTWTLLDAPRGLDAGSGFTTVVLADAGRGRVIPVLEDLRWAAGNRADERLAAALAGRTLREVFHLDEADVPGTLPLEPYLMGDGGVAILPYASGSLDVTVLAAMSGDTRIDPQRIREYLQGVLDDPGTWPRDRQLLALAGLAALGDPVLPEVQAADRRTDLTVPERVSLALAALYAGDESLARSVERALLAEHGERHGPWVRLDAGAPNDASLETARLAIVAASLGDPVSADMDAWIVERPSRATSLDLERVLAAAGWARRAPAADASAAVTVDGVREVVRLAAGETRRLALTPAQAGSARLEPSTGRVLVVQTVGAPYTAGSLTSLARMAMTRSIEPSGTVGATDTVIVTLRVTLGSDARDECWRVTDMAPSGLAPVQPGSMYDPETGAFRWTTASPDLVDGQRVEFCVTRNPKVPTQTLRYVARVVTSGSYAWEPAILQSTMVPDEGVVTPPATVTIAGLAS